MIQVENGLVTYLRDMMPVYLGEIVPIFAREAPIKSTLPYVIVAKMSGTPEYLMAMNGPISYRYQVQGVSVATGGDIGGRIDRAIERCLNNADFQCEGLRVIRCKRTADIDYREDIAGRNAYHEGGIYEITVGAAP